MDLAHALGKPRCPHPERPLVARAACSTRPLHHNESQALQTVATKHRLANLSCSSHIAGHNAACAFPHPHLSVGYLFGGGGATIDHFGQDSA